MRPHQRPKNSCNTSAREEAFYCKQTNFSTSETKTCISLPVNAAEILSVFFGVGINSKVINIKVYIDNISYVAVNI